MTPALTDDPLPTAPHRRVQILAARSVLRILLAAVALAAAGAAGWWLRGRSDDRYSGILGDFIATEPYTAHALGQANTELELRLSDVRLSPKRSSRTRCLIIPGARHSIEIVYDSGDLHTAFPEQLHDELEAFALKRLAEVTAEDQGNGFSGPECFLPIRAKHP